jgi:hypothetical protein
MMNGEQLALQLFERDWSGAAVIVAPAAELAAVHQAFEGRWRALLRAMSAGIAHADPDDASVAEREKRLSALQKVVVAAPGTQAAGRAVLFLDEASTLPPGAVVIAPV